jgi:Glycosyltransferase family 87
VNTRPRRAGGLLGLLCIKPQYALLVPLVVCAGRHWRAMLAGGAAVLALLVLSLCWGGAGGWIGYLGPGRAAMSALLVRNCGGFQVMGTSVFWMLRSFGVSLGAAYAGQGVVSALAALGCWVMWRGPAAEPMRRLAMTVFLTLLASPYGFTDDLAVYSVMLAVLARRETPWRNAGLAGLWVAPAFVPKYIAVFGFLRPCCLWVPPRSLGEMGIPGRRIDQSQNYVLQRKSDERRYALRSKNKPCSPNRLARATDRRQGARAPASSAASHCSTL